MDVGFLSALSALAGSVVGGLTTGITTWMALRAQLRAGHYAHEMARLEELFRDFIVAASRAYGKALTTNDPDLQDLVAIYAMVGRMRVMCSPQIIACAD
ncbi:MAG: hypothetical protein JO255_01025, partial [Alphaproteobacteria bacterium]|nr:hypothetical protein [Alphaproteobacteria bacterium]